MPNDSDFQPRLGTALATFAQSGTFSNRILLSGRLVGLYSDNYPVAAGSIDFYSSFNSSGTGYPMQTPDGTVLKLSAFGAGTVYSFGQTPQFTNPIGFLGLRVGTAGTATGAAGGTIVLICEER